MEQLVDQHKIIPIPWARPVFPLAIFPVSLVGKIIENCDILFVTAKFSPRCVLNNILYTVKTFKGGGNHQSSLKHMEVNIQNIIIIF